MRIRLVSVGAQAVRAIVAALSVALVVGCTPILRSHGYAPTDADLALLQVGRDTRETVQAAVGPPSATGLLTANAWYYVQSQFRYFGPREPEEIDRQVVAISFAEDGRIANIERFGLEQGQVVALSRRVTDSNVGGISLIQQLIGNVGRLDAGNILGAPGGP
jgi:outer membrane protein assembly factor BamE (lipoprotein component of BamABCDE complex)